MMWTVMTLETQHISLYCHFDYSLGDWDNQEAVMHHLTLHQNTNFQFLHYYLLKKKISATKTNFEIPPTGGGARGWIRNSPELAGFHFHFRLRNQGKGGEHSAMGSIMQWIHVLFIKCCVLSNRSKFTHNRLPVLLAHDEGVNYIIFSLMGVTVKCLLQW